MLEHDDYFRISIVIIVIYITITLFQLNRGNWLSRLQYIVAFGLAITALILSTLNKSLLYPTYYTSFYAPSVFIVMYGLLLYPYKRVYHSYPRYEKSDIFSKWRERERNLVDLFVLLIPSMLSLGFIAWLFDLKK
jgi:hypothetical protein